MPAILRVGPHRFFFYSADAGEPPHVHVARDASEAKFWIDPCDWSAVEDSPLENSGTSRRSSRIIEFKYGRLGMTTLESESAVAMRVRVSDEAISVELLDGRTVTEIGRAHV